MAVTTADEALAAPRRFAGQPLAVVTLVRRDPAPVFSRPDTDVFVGVVPATLILTSRIDAGGPSRRQVRARPMTIADISGSWPAAVPGRRVSR